ncbi:MAG TPA: glycosyltransferase family 1 protein [Roseiflexaceae bacterium]|nr:glycosyltransferase family 1 protein [Roseiflexaceae bacterium]
MHIAIDYTAAVWQGAGIGRYTRELVAAIVAKAPDLRYTLFYASGGLSSNSPFVAELQRLCGSYPTVKAVGIPLPPRRLVQLWHRLRLPLPLELFTGRIDLLHQPDFALPPARARSLVTVHDLSYMVHPECAVPGVARYLNSAVPRSIRRAEHILSDSHATRNDMLRLLGVPGEKVSVVYPGVSPRFRPLAPEATADARRRLGLPERFLLFVGTLEPRKNLPRLIEALAMLRDRGRLPEEMPLIIGGKRGWMYQPIFDAISRHRMEPHVRLIDYIDDADLPIVYNLAWAFVYPSIYEGFGLPALEALACGTPVVTADNSSLPEVVGDIALRVPADDVAALAAALEQVIGDEALRARLRAEGPQRAALFTWEQAAEHVLAHYRH